MNFNRFALATLFKSLSWRRPRLGNKIAIGVLTVITAVAAAPKEAEAQWAHSSSAHNTSSPVNTQTFAPALEGISGSFRLTDAVGNQFVRDLTIYDALHGITTAHTVPPPGSTAVINTVGTSSNYNNPAAGQQVGVASWRRDPRYDGRNYDLAVITFSEPLDLSQFPNRPNGPLSIATSLPVGTTFLLAGRAPWGAPDIGMQQADGKLRVSTTVGSVNSSIAFQDANFWAGQYSLSIDDTLNSIGTDGISGGTSGINLYNPLTGNSNFQFLGPIAGGTFPTPAHEGFTYVSKVDSQFMSIIPEPNTFGFFAIAGSAALARRRRIKGPQRGRSLMPRS